VSRQCPFRSLMPLPDSPSLVTRCFPENYSDTKADWHSLDAISALAQLAALLHDLGKASVAFQKRLRLGKHGKNLYRHEWVSLRLFQAFVGASGGDGGSDSGWLRRLAASDFTEADWTAEGCYFRDGVDEAPPRPFETLPPLARAVGWLILTHHRLPLIPVSDEKGQRYLGTRSKAFNLRWFEDPLALVDHDWNEVNTPADQELIAPYWEFASPLPVSQAEWKTQAAQLARHLLEAHTQHLTNWIDNPYVMHLARLSLMLADHCYSSLPLDSTRRVRSTDRHKLFANTDDGGRLKQPLDDHLLGVTREVARVTHALSCLEHSLPRLAGHHELNKRSANPQFSWQDKAAAAAASLQERASTHGAFVINMASTGCGKTLANARILYSLANPERGLRAIYAIGLRALTLQVGGQLQKDLHLNKNELAVLVGGSGSRDLFKFYQKQAENTGSPSCQELVEEDSHVVYEGHIGSHSLLGYMSHDPNIAKLLSAPMLVCTVDHMTPATESLRSGRQIAPMLRLMSSDLILDELDDYDLNDLPALTRLVYWAGMLGSRVVLSSATLPPSLAEGMYLAWRSGRMQYHRNRSDSSGEDIDKMPVPCLWVDEFGVEQRLCADSHEFSSAHDGFIKKRAAQLVKAEPLRRAKIVRVDISKEDRGGALPQRFAEHLRTFALQSHDLHAETDPVSGKRVSFGVIRMANIDPLFDIARSLFALGAPENTHIHLCVYHARFPLLQRSAIESLLDAVFNRKGDPTAVYQNPSIRKAINDFPEENHLFVVIASPVCEVGRDWDGDWAIPEPSSLRALIQLAGRIQRHRKKCGTAPNLLILNRNFKSFQRKNGDFAPVFIYPGFESHDKSLRFRLCSTDLNKLLLPDEYSPLTARPRICPREMSEWQSRKSLSDLEQARIASSMLPRNRLPNSFGTGRDAAMQRDEATWLWAYPQAALTGVLPQQQPFRESERPEVTLVFLPDEGGDRLILNRIAKMKDKGRKSPYVSIARDQLHAVAIKFGERISSWGEFDLMQLLSEQSTHLGLSLCDCAKRFATLRVVDQPTGWRYHPVLGFASKCV